MKRIIITVLFFMFIPKLIIGGKFDVQFNNFEKNAINIQKNNNQKIQNLKTEIKYLKSDTIKVNLINRLSELYFATSKYDSSLIFANQALSLSQFLKWDKGLAESNFNVGNILLLKYKFTEAKINFENSLKSGNKIHNCQIIGNNLIGIANVFSGLKEYSKAENYFNLANSKFQECNNLTGKCLVNQNLALMFQKEGKNDSALIYFQKALEFAQKNNDKSNISKIYGYIGNIHIFKSNFTDALSYFQKSIKIDEEIANLKGLINDYSNLGVLYINMYTMPKALDYIGKALKLAEELGDMQVIGKILYNKGIATEKSSGNYDEAGRLAKLNEAMKLYETSLKIAVDLEDKNSIGLSLERLGNINFWLNNNQKAITHFENAHKIYEEIGGKFEIATITGKLGVMYFAIATDSLNNISNSVKKNYISKGFEYVKNAIEQNTKFEFYDQLRTNYINITNMYFEMGDSINAFKSESELYKITNKMFYLSKFIEITKIEKEYELEFQQKIFENKNLKVQFQLKQSELERKNIEFKNLNSLQQIQKLELEQIVDKFNLLEKDKKIQTILIKQKDIANKKKIEELELRNQERNYRIGVLVAILLISIMALYFWRMRKNNIDLAAKNRIITDTNIELDYLNSSLYIKNEQIEITNKNLSESNATKDKFFSIIAHDLRNPLTALISGSELLLNFYHKYNDEKRLVHIKRLSTSSVFLYKMLENLLLWARSQTDNIEFSPKIHSLNSVIKENFELHKLNLQEKQISFHYNFDSDIHLSFDRNMINTVIRNLLSNAIKFTQEGGEIEIGVVVKPSEGFIDIFVKDSGVGIPKYYLEKLFRIDSTVSTAGTNNEKGTGLGLILCKEFVEKHGGMIWVESKVGNGSTFWFSLQKNLN